MPPINLTLSDQLSFSDQLTLELDPPHGMKLTQFGIEVLAILNRNMRLSQFGLEVLANPGAKMKLSQFGIEVVYAANVGNMRLSQMGIEVIYLNPFPSGNAVGTIVFVNT